MQPLVTQLIKSIILDTSEDMNVQCAEKMVYRTDEDTVACMVELILKTEEGEKDSMFNPLVQLYGIRFGY